MALTKVPSNLDATVATTQSASDNSTNVATTAYVTTAISNLIDSSPSALNTLNELAAALNDDASFSTTVNNSIATKLPLAGGTLTGNLAINNGAGATLFMDDTNGRTLRFRTANSGSQSANISSYAGLYLGGSDNASHVLIDGNGNVGIGTTPAGSVLLDLKEPGSSSDLLIGLSAGTGARAQLRSIAQSDGTSSAVSIHTTSSGATSERMRIEADGKVGIGIVSSLDSNLHVADGAAQINIEGTSGDATLKLESTGNSYWNMFIDQSDARKLKFEDNGNGVALTVQRDGNVGIGTSSPTGPLHIAGSGATVPIKIDNTGTGGTTWRIWSTNNSASDGGGKLGFYNEDSASRIMTLEHTGNVGIGTTAPGTKLDITTVANTAGIRVTAPNTTGQSFGATIAAGTNSSDYAFNINNAAGGGILRVRGDGNVGFGENNPSAKIHINSTGAEQIHLQRAGHDTFRIGLSHSVGVGFHNVTDSRTDFMVGGAGDVGIGTATPSGGKLHVYANTAADPYVLVDGSAANRDSGYKINAGGGIRTAIRMDVGNNMYFANNNLLIGNTGYATFANNVNLTAGTLTSTHSATITSQTNMQLALRDTDNTAMRANFMVDKTANSSRGGMAIQVTESGVTNDRDLYLQPFGGRVGIHTSSPAGGTALHVSGTDLARFDGQVVVNTGSVDTSASMGGQSPELTVNGYSSLGGLRVSGSDGSNTLYRSGGDITVHSATHNTILKAPSTLLKLSSGKVEVQGSVDLSLSGNRMSAFVQDMFHIGVENHGAQGSSRYGAGTTRTYVDGGASGYQGYVFGQENWSPPVYIPYSPNQVYRISASIYQLTGSTATGGASSRHYLGLIGYDENFNFVSVDSITTYQYILSANTTVNTGSFLEVDRTMKGWQGAGQNDYNKMDQGTVYIKPLWLGNYQSAGATAVLTGFSIIPAGTIADNDSNAGTNY